MATFCYTTKCGETVEDNHPCGKAPKKIKLPDGRWAYRDLSAEWSGERTKPLLGWPIYSDALGVHPDQIKDTQAFLEKRGITAGFTQDGRCIVESRQQRNAIMEARGFHDRDAGYGDR